MTRIYEVANPNYADLSVRVINSPAMADLVVYRDDNAMSEAHGEEFWTFVPKRENAHLSVYFAPGGMTCGHISVAFTNDRRKAGWQRFHKFRGNLNATKQRYKTMRPERANYWGG